MINPLSNIQNVKISQRRKSQRQANEASQRYIKYSIKLRLAIRENVSVDHGFTLQCFVEHGESVAQSTDKLLGQTLINPLYLLIVQ